MTNKQQFPDAHGVLKAAKIAMMMQKNTSFYTTILFSLKQSFDTEINTAGVDGKNLVINPKFFTDLTPQERIGLLAHEVLHVALDHMHRVGTRDKELWNVAADYVINNSLLKANYKLPAGGLFDSKYIGMTTEQVYDILYKKSEEQKQQLKASCDGDVTYPDPSDPAKSNVTKEEVTEIIMRATTQAKAMGQDPGTLPAEIDLNLQQTLNPPLPWHIILRRYLTERTKDDYSFRKPNRRFMPDFYLPTLHSDAICNLSICVDTSGSVSDQEFNDFITKIDQIQKLIKPKKITVVSFDSKIKSTQDLNEGEDAFRKLKFQGRGGTQIEPVHQWIAENKPTVCIIFTDGHFTQTKPVNKSIPLIWLIYNNNNWKTPYGRVINYEM